MHVLFSESFLQSLWNPYAGIFDKFARGASAATPQALLDYMLDLFEARADSGSIYRLQVIHGLGKFPGPLVGQVTPNTGKVFGYLDNVIEHSGELVKVTESIFDFTPEGPVLPLEHHKAALLVDGGLECHAPEDGGPFDTLLPRTVSLPPASYRAVFSKLPTLFSKFPAS
eukprot:jgi/Psemu1/20949/gm1.20949_g